MIASALADLWQGFHVALQPHNLFWCFTGVLFGNLVGVLPGMGVMAAISVLLPLTFTMQPVAAILMLAGIYYGAQYGGAICSILLNLPCHPPHAVTCLVGYPLTRQGRGGAALGITMLSSFVGASFGIIEMIFFAPFLVSLFRHLGAAPTTLNFNEVYSALQTGIVDGQENPLVLIDTAKLYEVQKYCSLTNHVWAGFHTSFNVAAWKKLPPGVQETVHRVFGAEALAERRDFVTMTDMERKNLTDKGLTFNAPDVQPFRAALAKSGFYQDIRKTSGDEAWTLLEKYVGTLG